MLEMEKNKESSDFLLDLICNTAKEELGKLHFNEAKKLCVRGQQEAAEKKNKHYLTQFDNLYFEIENRYTVWKKDKSERLVKDDLSGLGEEMNKDDSNEESIEGNGKLGVIKGVGTLTAQRLNSNGIYSIDQLAEYNPSTLSEYKGIGLNTAKKIIENAKAYLKEKKQEPRFHSLEEFTEEKESLEIIPEHKEKGKEPVLEIKNEIPFEVKEEQIPNFEIEDVKSEVKEERIPEINRLQDDLQVTNDVREDKTIYQNKQDDVNEDFCNDVAQELGLLSQQENKEEQDHIKKIASDFLGDTQNYESEVIQTSIGKNNVFREERNDRHTINMAIPKIKREDNILTIEQYDSVSINTMIRNVSTRLKNEGYHIIPKSSQRSIEELYQGIDIIAVKVIKINDELKQILILPIKICTLKGNLIIDSEEITYIPSQKKNTLRKKTEDLLLSSNYHELSKSRNNIRQNILKGGILFRKIKQFTKKNIIIEKTRSNNTLSFKCGDIEFRNVVAPTLICMSDIGFQEKSILFPYIKSSNFHFIYTKLFDTFLEFIEQKYICKGTYDEQPNLAKTYFSSQSKFINDLRLYSVPFVIYGFIFSLILIFQANFLISIFIFLTIGVLILYGLMGTYLYVKFNNERQEIKELSETSEEDRSSKIDETDLLIIKNELSPEFFEQFIFECFGKSLDNLSLDTNLGMLADSVITLRKSYSNQITNDTQKKPKMVDNREDIPNIHNFHEEPIENKEEKKHKRSGYMSLLED